jgi:hypothetical protein
MQLRDRIDADRRLVMLRMLTEAPGYCLGESMLDEVLAAYGHRVSRDWVRAQMSWLKEQGLVSIEQIGEIMIATLTGRGEDVANGEAEVPGVKRPRPRG